MPLQKKKVHKFHVVKIQQSRSCLGWCLAGIITTATAFDRERQRQFTLSVTATDQADQPLVGICSFTVQVADQNDNKPRFENSRYQCEYRRPAYRRCWLCAVRPNQINLYSHKSCR